jgi:hypothetical protein
VNDVGDNLSAAERRLRHSARLPKIMPELIGRLAWSCEQLDALQGTRASGTHFDLSRVWGTVEATALGSVAQGRDVTG